MGNTTGPPADVINEVVAVIVDRGDPRFARDHERPFGLLVPMQLAHAAGIEPHVDARDRGRGRQLALRDLARPAALAHFHVRVGERIMQVRDRAVVGFGRVDEIRVFPGDIRIARAQDGAALLPMIGSSGLSCAAARATPVADRMAAPASSARRLGIDMKDADLGERDMDAFLAPARNARPRPDVSPLARTPNGS